VHFSIAVEVGHQHAQAVGPGRVEANRVITVVEGEASAPKG